jgi:hypothetical protein
MRVTFGNECQVTLSSTPFLYTEVELKSCVRFVVFPAVPMTKAVFRDVTP